MNTNDSECHLDHLSGQAPQLDRKKPSIAKRLLLAALVVFLFAGLGMGLGMAYRLVNPRLYQSEAKIFVDERRPLVAYGQERSNIDLGTSEKYLSIIKSDQVLVDVIESGKFKNFETFKGSEPLQLLRNGLLVEKENTRSNSGVIQLVFSGSNPEECKMVLNGVIASFNQYIRDSNDAQKRPTEKLQRSLNDTTDELKYVEDEIQTLTSSPLIRTPSSAEERHNSLTEILLKTKQDRVKTQVALAYAEAEVSDTDELPQADQNQIKQLEDKIASLRLEEAELLKKILKGQPRLNQVSDQGKRLEKLRRKRDRLQALYDTLIEKLSETTALNEHLWQQLSVLDPPTADPELVGLNSATCSAIGLILGGLVGIFVATVGLIVSLLLWK
ncbi:hypothetical protein N9Y42_04345 [Mariniblastus sp.]|nr:hypothetical protein [Mariniblastus sp.]